MRHPPVPPRLSSLEPMRSFGTKHRTILAQNRSFWKQTRTFSILHQLMKLRFKGSSFEGRCAIVFAMKEKWKRNEKCSFEVLRTPADKVPRIENRREIEFLKDLPLKIAKLGFFDF